MVNCNTTANEAIVQDAVVAPATELHSHLHINEAVVVYDQVRELVIGILQNTTSKDDG